MATKTAERPATQQTAKEAPRDNLPAAKQKPPIVQFREYVEARMATLEDALPPTITPKRFVSVVMTALQNKPKLLECTFPSLWNACVRAAQDGLLPDGREGAIAPYGENKDGKRTAEIATWMPMIEGYRKKIFETGKVKAWEVNVVREKDDFEYELGDNAFIRHKPYMGAGAPGGIVGAYSIAKLLSGETVREVMSAFEINQIAAKSKASTGPWKDAAFVGEMSKKVVARRHYKQLPHTESMDAMIAREDADHGLADPEATPIARPTQTRRIASRDAFDAYAGATVDNETGEVIEDEAGASDQDFQNTETKPATASERSAEASSREAGAGPSTAGSSGPASNSSKATAVSSPSGEATGTEADAANKGIAAASASTALQETNQVGGSNSGATKEAGATNVANGASASTSTADIDELPEDEQIDGADRPWPAGATPTNEAEYERFLDTTLATMTDASKVAPWWNSSAQKDLRAACKVVRFTELQNKAIARRKELGEKPVR